MLYRVFVAKDILIGLIDIIHMGNDVLDCIGVELIIGDDGMLAVEYANLYLADLDAMIK